MQGKAFADGMKAELSSVGTARMSRMSRYGSRLRPFHRDAGIKPGEHDGEDVQVHHHHAPTLQPCNNDSIGDPFVRENSLPYTLSFPYTVLREKLLPDPCNGSRCDRSSLDAPPQWPGDRASSRRG